MEKLAVTVEEAAEIASVPVSIIRIAVKRGILLTCYPANRPVIRVTELDRWLDALPHGRP